MMLGLLLFARISAACASSDIAGHPEWIRNLAAVAEVESHFETLAIRDNSSGTSYSPRSEQAALQIATQLIVNQKHSVDVGLMQINSANLSKLGLSISDAFDACHSITAGSHILRNGYQRALRMAFSLYNTGDALKGLQNGYVAKVEAAGSRLAGMQQDRPSDAAPSLNTTLDVAQPPSCAPAWDVWAAAECSRNAAAQSGLPPSDGVTSVSLNQTKEFAHDEYLARQAQ